MSPSVYRFRGARVNLLPLELLVDILDRLPDSGPPLIETGGEPSVRGRLVAEARRHSFPAPWN